MPRSVSALKQTGKIRVGVIGDGHLALRSHIAALNLLAEYELIGVSNQAEQEALSEQHAELGCAVISATELITHPEVDLIAIAGMPTRAQHWICDAIAARKDIYCEWPIAPDPQIATELALCAQSSGVDHFIGLHPRICRGNLYVADLVAQGYLGQIRSVRLFAGTNKPTGGSSPITALHPQEESQPLAVLALRLLDGVLPVVRRPRHLYCLMAGGSISEGALAPSSQGAHQLAILGSADNGAIFSAQLDGSLRLPHVLIDIAGDRGRIKCISPVDDHAETVLVEAARGDDQLMQPLPIPRSYNWSSPAQLPSKMSTLANLYAAFVRDLHEGTSIVATLDDGARMHHLLHSILEASSSGRRIDLG
jgi:predicted dehydrogenase